MFLNFMSDYNRQEFIEELKNNMEINFMENLQL